MVPDYMMQLCAANTYKDIHVGMKDTIPPVSTKLLDCFLSQFDANMDKKITHMFDTRYIRFIRVSIADGENTMIRAQVWAEMKKNVSYMCDLRLDQFGMIIESQCECGAGQGPTAHCKHCQCAYFALSQLKEKKRLITEQTCTQKLQKFHRAKANKGSPMQSTAFSTIRKQSNLEYDPRPPALRHSVLERSRNICIGYQAAHPASSNLGKMPILQCIKPANPYALYKDHWYFSGTGEDRFLSDQKITRISEEEVRDIEAATRGQAASRIWKEQRRIRITASRVGDVVNATERRDMEALVRSVIRPVKFDSAATRHGRKYESVALDRFAKLYGAAVSQCGLFIHKERPYLAASPDGLLNQDTVIEVKCPYTNRDKVITSVTVPWIRPDNTLKKRHKHYYQVQTQMACTGLKKCKLIVFTSADMKIIDVAFDEECVSELYAKVDEFFTVHFREAVLEEFLYRSYKSFSFE